MGSKPCRPIVSFDNATERLDAASFEQLRRDFVRLAAPGYGPLHGRVRARPAPRGRG